MRLTEKIEPYLFQWFIQTAHAQQCERIIVIYCILIFSFNDIFASRLCERVLRNDTTCRHAELKVGEGMESC